MAKEDRPDNKKSFDARYEELRKRMEVEQAELVASVNPETMKSLQKMFGSPVELHLAQFWITVDRVAFRAVNLVEDRFRNQHKRLKAAAHGACRKFFVKAIIEAVETGVLEMVDTIGKDDLERLHT